MTRAVDIDCPKGHAKAGTYCNDGVDLCQERINAAGAITREANRALREKAKERR